MNKPTISSKLIENSTNALFVREVLDDSPIEMDWLWLATQVSAPAEKQFCYEKALFINPYSSEARRGLYILDQQAHLSGLIARIAHALDFLVAHSAFDHMSLAKK